MTFKLVKRENPAFGLTFDYNPERLDKTYTLVENKKESLLNHKDVIEHTLINGENLKTLIALGDSIKGKVDLCYIDPPYNTGNSTNTGFTYKDSFKNKEDRESHSTWLTFMYDRLVMTKSLLSEKGVLAISIDDSEVHYLRLLCDEIFGEINFIAQIVVDGGNIKNNARFISITHEYLLVYAKDLNKLGKSKVKWRTRRDGVELLLKEYEELKKKHKTNYPAITKDLKKWVKTALLSNRLKVFFNADIRGLYTYADLSAPGDGARYRVLHPVTKKPCQIPSRGWGLTEEKLLQLIETDMVIFGKDEKAQPLKKLYLKDEADQVARSVLAYPSRSSTHLLEKILGRRKSFNNPKNLEFITDMVSLMCPEDGLVLDYFAGSGTTGHAVLNLNKEGAERRFILITKNENKIFNEVTYPRLKAVITGKWLDDSEHKSIANNLRVFNLKEE